MRADHGEGANGGTNGSTNGTEAEISDSLKTFGAVLKALREESRLTQEEFAPRVRYSAAYVAKIEQGKRFPPADLPARAEEALGPVAAKVLAAAARSLTRRSVLASWFRQWAGIEEEAISLYAYECRAIPGLLQPEAYIRAIFDRRMPPASEEQIEREVASRLERQQIIATNQNTAFSFIIEESVVARRMGGCDVTRQVIDRLLEMSSRRNVEIQIMATVQEDHCGIDGQMYLAETAAHQWLGYTEGQRSSNLISAPKDVSVLLQRYGKLRSQALNCRATVELLEQMRGAL
ncbi:helix-turn-helix domain-containing protein [Streptomyces sudanensis]|uniref:helix-turn-helix domain-containing protein n=1 Tax=Streptomyces sudanensis TaxID=436397 RepID=UPI0020CEECA4|nr:helix-turn-helix transcriptional regulator [Streptomyces sudanensis]MCP9959483.1 helix-turn-helix transcriptional regulator [Streptomyces sudanensis]MCP9988547.1 helix-turn-helix transcriptional regulator [Streptomyces sudanensis]MCQ0000070.1 helix-turn-helix transcriptional regulator [Streptomyces sudanensis]